MSKFKDIIIARNGRDFFINWQKSLEKEKDALQNSNFEIKGELGKGGRGIVFLAEQDGAEVAAKVFVYQDECIPQASALFLWDGFAPKVLRIFSERTLLLEVLPEHGNIRNKYSLETGALLLSKIKKASPAERGGALSAYEYFTTRLKRAHERNKEHGLYSKALVSKIEKIFGAHKANENQIIHGDFSPGNVLFCSEAKVIDPRSFLWGEESLDAAKWALSIKRGRSAEEGVRFFTSKGFSEQALYFWLLIQAYDDSSAFASFPSHDDRIESYSSIVKKLIKLF